MIQPKPPPAVVEISRRLESSGYSTWAVGGAVRDTVLGLEGGDWDLATQAPPNIVRRHFRRTVPIGIEHGTVGVFAGDGVLYEVTTFRRDVETTGRHAVVEFADTIEEDLSRRDFTCNALAWHPIRRELRDPYGGVADLEQRLLRTVGHPAQRFSEDYLRVLRALRFAGRFRLEIARDTWLALVRAVDRLPELSAERVREELWKVFTGSRNASAALSLYAAAGVLPVLYPELEAVLAREVEYGPEQQPWTESLRAVDAAPPSRPVIRLSALLHRIGWRDAAEPEGAEWDEREPDTGSRLDPASDGAAAGCLAEELMRRLKASNADTERVRRLVTHQHGIFPPDADPRAVRHWLRAAGPDLVNDLFRLRIACWRGRRPGERPPAETLTSRWEAVREELRTRPPLSVADLAIGGDDLKDLGLRPGPRYGEILRRLLARVLDDPELNTRERLVALVREEIAR